MRSCVFPVQDGVSVTSASIKPLISMGKFAIKGHIRSEHLAKAPFTDECMNLVTRSKFPKSRSLLVHIVLIFLPCFKSFHPGFQSPRGHHIEDNIQFSTGI